MNPALKPILAAIESAVVRIEYARDDEHALNEAIQLAADVRLLLALLSNGPAFTEADPVPVVRRNCLTCSHCRGDQCESNARGVGTWCANNCDGSTPKPDADNCPGYTLHLTPPTARNTTLAP